MSLSRRAAFVLFALPLLAAAPARRARADGAFPDAQTVLLPADRPQQIIVAANFGLVISDDDGAHWQYTCEAKATTNGRQYSLGAPPDDRIFSLSDFGLATTSDGSCTWRLGTGPFEGVPNPLKIGRYHSLCTPNPPPRFKVHAAICDMAMAISDEEAKQVGVQFHPESVLTPAGQRILANVLNGLI